MFDMILNVPFSVLITLIHFFLKVRVEGKVEIVEGYVNFE